MTPTVVRSAGYVVLAEGVLALLVAAIYVVHALTGINQDAVRGLLSGFGYGTAVWFTIVGGAVAAAGWALITGRRWGRGLAVFANLILLGVAWYIYSEGQFVYAAVVAVLAVTVLGLLFSPAAVHWVSQRH